MPSSTRWRPTSGRAAAEWRPHVRDDLLLDGRDRALAGERAGVPVAWETVRAVGARDASLVVTSWSLQRRHLDESRRALAAAKLANQGAPARAASSVKENTPGAICVIVS